MLYFLLDIAAPGLETLTTPQRIWLYGNIVASSGSEMTVPKRLSLRACLKTFDKNDLQVDNKEKQAGAEDRCINTQAISVGRNTI